MTTDTVRRVHYSLSTCPAMPNVAPTSGRRDRAGSRVDRVASASEAVLARGLHLPRSFSSSKTKTKMTIGIALIANPATKNQTPAHFKNGLSLISPVTKRVAAIKRQPTLPANKN
jgi:hypothetical protein